MDAKRVSAFETDLEAYSQEVASVTTQAARGELMSLRCAAQLTP